MILLFAIGIDEKRYTCTYIDKACCVFDAVLLVDQPTKIDQDVLLAEHVDGQGFPGQVMVT